MFYRTRFALRCGAASTNCAECHYQLSYLYGVRVVYSLATLAPHVPFVAEVR